MTHNPPRVSIIIPAYNSDETIQRCLDTLGQQTYQNFETVIVDSSPNQRTADLINEHERDVLLIKSSMRLLPHDARNRGAIHAKGELLVFTDPDIYFTPIWLEHMVNVYDETEHVIVGAVDCHSSHWMSVGKHLSKFDKWLPGGEPRSIDIGPTANLMCSRAMFDKVGGFTPNYVLSDTLFSWRVTEIGHALWFVPAAVVQHHHLGAWDDLLNERYQRGKEFGYLRQAIHQWSFFRTLLHLVVTLLPLRIVKLMARIFANARRSGRVFDFWRTLPVTLTAQSAWLLGEAAALSAALIRRR